MNEIIDIAIIGGGAAGLTAGLYAARANLKTVLFEEFFPGGQTATIEKIDNYPGFENGVEGSVLMQNMNSQAVAAGMETKYEKIISLKKNENIFELENEDGIINHAKTVIIATGASPRKIGIAKEEFFAGRGIHYCATCDGAFYKNKIVTVYGGANTALTDALVLSNYAEKVYIVYRGEKLKGEKILSEKVSLEPKIEVIYNSVITKLGGEKRLNAIEIHNNATGENKILETDGVFVAIGIEPKSDLVKDIVELSKTKQIITDKNMMTIVEGMYAAGDVRDSELRQVITAAADGALSASMAIHYINTHLN